jgi:hypothetical protein
VSEASDEAAPPTVRVQDKCAWCGHALAVVNRSWEKMTSDPARVVCANYCNEDNGCAHAGCPKNCHLRAESKPRKVVVEIQRRQQVARRDEERRVEARRAKNEERGKK